MEADELRGRAQEARLDAGRSASLYEFTAMRAASPREHSWGLPEGRRSYSSSGVTTIPRRSAPRRSRVSSVTKRQPSSFARATYSAS